MKQELKNIWVTAMESGRYVYTDTELRSSEGPNVCCSLGVLMMECGYNPDDHENQWNNEEPGDIGYDPECTEAMPSYTILESWGIDHDIANGVAKANDANNGKNGYADVIKYIKENL